MYMASAEIARAARPPPHSCHSLLIPPSQAAMLVQMRASETRKLEKIKEWELHNLPNRSHEVELSFDYP